MVYGGDTPRRKEGTMTTTTTTYSIFLAEGREWEDSEGHTVLSSPEDGWIADLDDDGHLMDSPYYLIAAAAARALGLPEYPELDLAPVGYTTGQTNPVNYCTYSSVWEFSI